MNRLDGRAPSSSRAPRIVTGVIANTCGSASVEIGPNKVVCNVRGPLQLTTEYRGNKGKIVCNVSYAPFARSKGSRIDPQAGIRGVSSERELGFIMEGICEQIVILESFPQLYYELNFVILSSEGSDDLPALCAGACSALLEAGVEMTDIFTGSSAALLPNTCDGTYPFIVVDPTIAERMSAPAICTVVSSTSTGKALYISHEGAASPEVIAQLFKYATAGCVSQRSALLKNIRAGGH